MAVGVELRGRLLRGAAEGERDNGHNQRSRSLSSRSGAAFESVARSGPDGRSLCFRQLLQGLPGDCPILLAPEPPCKVFCAIGFILLTSRFWVLLVLRASCLVLPTGLVRTGPRGQPVLAASGPSSQASCGLGRIWVCSNHDIWQARNWPHLPPHRGAKLPGSPRPQETPSPLDTSAGLEDLRIPSHG